MRKGRQAIVGRGIGIGMGAAMLAFVLGTAAPGFGAQWAEVLRQIQDSKSRFAADIKDMRMVQEMTTVTPEGSMQAEMTLLQKGNKFRSESSMNMPGMPESMGPMKTTIIFDGKDTWMISSMMGQRKLSPQESREQQRDKNWWHLLSEKATITGRERVGGRDCYIVEMKDQKNAAFTRLWLDEKKLVPMKMESKASRNEIIITEFSDFRAVKGPWEMPYQTTMYRNGEVMATVRVKSLEVNTGISDEEFSADAVPAEETGFSLGDMMKELRK